MALNTLTQQGAFTADLAKQINDNFSNTVNAASVPSTINGLAVVGQGIPPIVALSQNASGLAFGAFGTPITLLASGAPAGTYRATVYAVVKTTITTATSWLFTLAFTDDVHSQTPTVSTSSTMTANAAEQGSYTFRSTGAAAITFTPTAASADGGAIVYSVVLERLI